MAEPVPATALIRWLLAGPKLPVATWVKLWPSLETSILKPEVEAESASPQVAPGSTPKPWTSTGTFIAIVIALAPPGPFVELGDVLPQPVPSDESIAPAGPHPLGDRFGPLNAEM